MKKFEVDFKNAKLIGDLIRVGGQTPHFLLLHGAGEARISKYQPIRELLAQKGMGSCAFDFIGHGETGGEMSSSSLKSRTEQALAVIKKVGLPTPLTLMGGSMGAYTALKVSEQVPVDKLILFVPAIYTRAAYEVSFGPKFSKIIRQPKSWEGSDAWEILSGFKGDLLVVGAENDEVVPREVVQRVYDSAIQAKSKKLYFIPNSPHQFRPVLESNPAEMNKVIDMIARCGDGR